MELAAPDSGELEVSIFGPGRGESIAVHLGDRRWGIVDSCRDYESQRPAALAYFDSIGVDAASQVDFVLATHWHDDHIRGLATIVREASSAKFYCSNALLPDEFLPIVLAQDEGAKFSRSGLDEFAAVIRALQRRKANGGVNVTPRYAMADRTLWRSTGLHAGTVVALSPSDADVTRAREKIASMLPAVGGRKLRVPAPTENDASVALSVEVSGRRVLLGADVLSVPNAERGWKAIVDEWSGDLCQIVKIPHHGAQGAHHEIGCSSRTPSRESRPFGLALSRSPLMQTGPALSVGRVTRTSRQPRRPSGSSGTPQSKKLSKRRQRRLNVWSPAWVM